MSLAEIAQGVAELERLQAKISELEAQEFEPNTAEDASRISKWQLWRRQELMRMQSILAKAAAAHQEVVKRCGRVVAEKAVLDKLLNDTADSVKLERDRRDPTFPDEQCPL